MIAPQLDLGLEMLLVTFADEAVDAVRRHDQIGVFELLEIGDFPREMELDAEFPAARVEDHQQRAALGAAKAMSGRSHRLAVEMEVDLIPVGEFARDRSIGRRVIVHQIVQRLVGKDDAEAERVVGLVTLIDGDVVVRKALLHQQSKVKPAGTAADDHDLHAAASLVRSARDGSLRPTPSYRSSTRSNHAAIASPGSRAGVGDVTRDHCSSPNKI